MGYPVKSHSSSIDNMLADRLRRQVEKMGLDKKAPKKKAAAPSKAVAPKGKGKAKVAAAVAVETEVEAEVEAEVGSVAGAVKAPEPDENVAKLSPIEEARRKTAAVKAAKAREALEHKGGIKASSPRPSAAAAEKISGDTPPKKSTAPKTPEEIAEEKQKLEETRRLQEKRIQEAVARKARELDEAKKREENKKKRNKLKTVEEKLSKETAQKRKVEDEFQRKQDEEDRRKQRVLDEERRRRDSEEAELQRLIAEEERSKREVEERRIVIDEATTVKEFAEKLKVGVNEVIKMLIGKGIMANLNQTIDVDVARELAVEMGYELKTAEETEVEEVAVETEEEENLEFRPPVVTIMGHVDHGKTSLLDTIRKTKVTETEAGGITQSIGAYTVKLPKGAVTFVDTPGHEAFTAMRSRGAAVTDIVVLVVAADDGVMPQTVEAIHHARAANVPVVVAVNKIDKPGANPERVRQELSHHELISEDWGGTTIFCEVSAKEQIGIDHLLEMLLLQAEVLELRANPNRRAFGTIIESRLDKGRGAVATVLVQKGTLKVGDPFVAGIHSGKVRALLDDNGGRIESAGPSIPVEVLGFAGVPNAGDIFMVAESDRKAAQIAQARQEQQRVAGLTEQARGHVRLENLHAHITKGEVQDLNIIIKADVQGSIEAVTKALQDIKGEEVRIRVLHGAVGGVTETDVSLAAASNAIIIGFNVRPTEQARALAEAEEVDVRLYSIIYNAIDDIKAALQGMLKPEYREVVTGRAEVRNVFNITKVGTIAGCMITSGKVHRNSECRLIRDSVVVLTGKIESLRRFKDDAKEVASGYECGIGIEKFNDIKVNDIIETFIIETVERTIA
jgi:translation initiation factor IF-2